MITITILIITITPIYYHSSNIRSASHMVLLVKNPPANAGDIRDTSSIPGLGRSPREGHGNPLQYSCLENSHGQRSLAGYDPQGHKESDTTEVTWHACMQVSVRISAVKYLIPSTTL